MIARTNSDLYAEIMKIKDDAQKRYVVKAKQAGDEAKKKGLCRRCKKRPLSNKNYCEECAAKAYSAQRRYRDKLRAKGICTRCGKKPVKPGNKWACVDCCAHQVKQKQTPIGRKKNAAGALRRYHELRRIVIDHYTGGTRRCQCSGCDVEGIEFLTVDHVNNDGAAHRKIVRRTGFFRWLIKNGFPAEFQILCWNCNCARHFYGHGVCPHTTKGYSNVDRAKTSPTAARDVGLEQTRKATTKTSTRARSGCT